MTNKIKILAVSIVLALAGLSSVTRAQDTYALPESHKDARLMADKIQKDADDFEVGFKDALMKAHFRKADRKEIDQYVKDFRAAAYRLQVSALAKKADPAAAE